MEDTDNTKQVVEVTKDLLSRLEVEATVDVVIDETGAYRVRIETEETGLLIGHHGKTLESLQLLLGIMVSKKIDKWVKVYVNVGDYREKREETLMHMAQRAADRALAMSRPVELSRLSPAERRIVHLTLSGDDRIATESIGEGDSRVLVVKPSTPAV